MYTVTVFGFEGRLGTRLQIGCEDVAEKTFAAARALGYDAKLAPGTADNRTTDEMARVARLNEKLAPIIFGWN